MNWNTKQVGAGKLILHCGAEEVSYDQLTRIPCPAPEGRHHPVPYHEYYGHIRNSLEDRGFKLGETVHATSKDDGCYFGLIAVESTPPAPYDAEMEAFSGELGEVLQHVVGIRSSHSKKFSHQLCMGTSVFVCDNLAFSGQILLRRKSTLHARRDLPELCHRAVDVIRAGQITEEQRIERYMGTKLDERSAAKAVVDVARSRGIGSSAVVEIMDSFLQPEHSEHLGPYNDRTVWTLQQAFTERFKRYSLNSVPSRSLCMQRQLDQLAGFEPQTSGVIELS